MNEFPNAAFPADKQVEVKIASVGARVAAYILNILFLILAMVPMIISLIVLVIYKMPHRQNGDASNLETALSTTAMPSGVFSHPAFLLCVAIFLAFGIWQIVMMSKRGQSLGKRLLKIKVIKTNGEEAGFVGTVLMREIAFSFLVGLVTALIGFIINMAMPDSPEPLKELLNNLISNLPYLICFIMLFSIKRDRRTLQDYLADTVVIKLPD
ncbi:MAG: RDD family protein [Neisseria sp.]|uniref:RDD family protein n=1 Tax=Neisseria sp. TaxID=192066 RepID=UPI0026DB078C|nr:RDD family protein [Neisseria sp.]MDO4640227.1 RDD family protein [Neisseria sp.]